MLQTVSLHHIATESLKHVTGGLEEFCAQTDVSITDLTNEPQQWHKVFLSRLEKNRTDVFYWGFLSFVSGHDCI